SANVGAEALTSCFEAGTDGSLPKPLAREALVNVLRRWLPAASAPARATRSPAPVAVSPRGEAAEPVLDHARLSALRDAIGEDFADVVTVFVESADAMLTALAAACERGEADAIFRHAHTLKSSAANVGAMALAALARRIERDATADVPSVNRDAVGELERELARVRPRLLQSAAEAKEGLRAVG